MRFRLKSLWMGLCLGICGATGCGISVVEAQDPARDSETVVFYVNGIFGTQTDSSLAVRELSKAVNDFAGSERLENVTFAINHNSTNGSLDILEYTLQDKLTDNAELWNWLSEYFPMPVWCQELVKQIEASFYRIGHIVNEDVRKHTNEYIKNIQDDRRILIVPHSQGNLFANLAFGMLSDQDRKWISIVGVANPDSFVAGGGAYTTLEEDMVNAAVDAAKILLGGPRPLPANFTNAPGGGSRDVLHHAFVPTYMESMNRSRARIAAGVVAALRKSIVEGRPQKPDAR